MQDFSCKSPAKLTIEGSVSQPTAFKVQCKMVSGAPAPRGQSARLTLRGSLRQGPPPHSMPVLHHSMLELNLVPCAYTALGPLAATTRYYQVE